MMMRATIPMDVLIIAKLAPERVRKYINLSADVTMSRIQTHALRKRQVYFAGLPANAHLST